MLNHKYVPLITIIVVGASLGLIGYWFFEMREPEFLPSKEIKTEIKSQEIKKDSITAIFKSKSASVAIEAEIIQQSLPKQAAQVKDTTFEAEKEYLKNYK